MPGFLTHYLGGQAVLALLPDEIKPMISESRMRIFNLGTQGSDIFFYYVPGFLRARTRNIGSEIHDADFGKFFMHMARYVKHEVLFAYLSGFLVHYALDCHTHPFVFAHTRREGISQKQESADHRHFETSVDVLMLARLTGEKPADYRQWELIQAPAKQKQVAAAAFGAAASKIYGRKILPQDVYHAMGHMMQLIRMLGSAKGRRKNVVSYLEDRTIGAHLISAMVHMQEVTDGRDYLNLSRAHWGAYNTSFPELFDAGVEEAVHMITGLYTYMQGEMERRELAEIIGNRSLSTGELCA
jgi:hypothetical protein